MEPHNIAMFLYGIVVYKVYYFLWNWEFFNQILRMSSIQFSNQIFLLGCCDFPIH